MRGWLWARRLALVVVAALAASVLPATAVNAVDNRTISGHVYLGDSARSAVAGEVKVSYLRSGYTPGPTQFTYTDADGNYLIPGLAQASYSVRFDFVGAEPFGSMVWPDKAPSSPTAGNYVISLVSVNKTGADIVLPRPADVGGTVYLGSAPAAAGEVAVYYEVLTTANWPGVWQASPVYTDAVGHYTLADLKSGVYRIWFDYLGDGPYQDVYYGNGFGPFTSTNVQIASEADLVRDMTLPGKRTISGEVTLEDPGNNVPGGSVMAGAGQVKVSWAYSPESVGPWVWSEAQSVTTDADGEYLIPEMLWGYYLMRMEYVGSGGRYLTVTKGETWNPLSMLHESIVQNGSLTRLFQVSGHVDIGTAGVSAGAGEATVKLAASYGTIATTTTDAAGNFTFPDITSRTAVSLVVTKSGTDWVQYISPSFDLNADLTKSALVKRMTTLSGFVRNEFGEPLDGWVSIYPCAAAGTNPGASYWTTASTSGYYSVRIDDYASYYVNVVPNQSDTYQPRAVDPTNPNCFDTIGGGAISRDITVPRAGAIVAQLTGPGAASAQLFKTRVELWRYQPPGTWVPDGESGDISSTTVVFYPVPAGLYVLVTRYYGASGTVKTSIDRPFTVRGDARYVRVNVAAVTGVGAMVSKVGGATQAEGPSWTALLSTEVDSIDASRTFAGRGR